MNAQGCKLKLIPKDNESEIHMLTNGKASCTPNSKHVAIKIFEVPIVLRMETSK